ncbi:MAG: hypothetical protein J6J16_02230 [Lachnospiraceae bacterium]|nr:hypothetical protein [Lachnospiraceae bacterium]
MTNYKKIPKFLAVFTLLLGLCACDKNNNNSKIDLSDITTTSEKITTEATTEITAEQTTEEQIIYNEFEDFYLVDYAVLAGILENQEGSIVGAVIMDPNMDGIGDLFVSKNLPESSPFYGRQTYYAFSDSSNPMCEIHTATGAAGSNYMAIYNETNIFYENDYAAATNTEISYYEWDYGWICQANYRFTCDENYNPIHTYTAGENNISAEEYASITEKYKTYTDISNNIDNIKEVSIENANYNDVVFNYREHLKKSNQNYVFEEGDIDGDGTNEACFFVLDYASPWRNNLWSYGELDEECFVNNGENFITLVYIDETGSNISFEIKYIHELDDLSHVAINDSIDIYDRYNFIHNYDMATSVNVLALNKIYYNGSVEEALYSQTFYASSIQAPCWTVYTFDKNGKCKVAYRDIDIPDLYSERYCDYTFDPTRNTLTIYGEDGYSTTYTYNEDYEIFETEPYDTSFPGESPHYVRSFIVAIPGTPTSEEFGYYSKFFHEGL